MNVPVEFIQQFIYVLKENCTLQIDFPTSYQPHQRPKLLALTRIVWVVHSWKGRGVYALKFYSGENYQEEIIGEVLKK